MSGTVSATGSIQLPDWVNQAAMQNYQTAMGLSQQPYTAYPGQIVAGFNPAQTAAFNAVQGQLGATAPAFATAMGNVQNLPATTQSLLNPYLGSVESDTVSNIQRAAALQGQQIAAQAQQGGAYGGTRYGVAQSVLDSETQRNIGQAINQIQSQGWNTASGLALNQAQTMAGLATGGQSAALQGAGALADVGSVQQQQQQAQLSAALSQWQQQQNWPYQQLAVAQGALAGSPYGTTGISSQPYSTNPLANALSTGAAIIPQLGNLVSSASSLFGGGSNPVGSAAWGSGPVTSSYTGAPFADTGSFDTSGGTIPGYTYSGWGDGSTGAAASGSALSGVGNWLSDAASSVGNFIGSIF